MHHHFAPPAWVTAVKGRPLLQPANTTWTPAKSIEDMDRGGVAASMVSITNPGLWFGDAMTKQLARACNEARREARAGASTRFGLFAAMPLPDIDATLAEVVYAYDTLKVDESDSSRAMAIPGWARKFRPVMEELNRRKAVVHVHPTAANCCRNLDYAPGVAPGSMEYGTIRRAIMGVAFSGDAARFPDVRFIWSHAGGTVQFLAGRIEGASTNAKDRLPNGFIGRDQEVLLRPRRRIESRRRGVAARTRQALAGALRHRFPAWRDQRGIGQLAELKLFSAADLRAIDETTRCASCRVSENRDSQAGLKNLAPCSGGSLESTARTLLVKRRRFLQLRVRDEVVLDPDLCLRPLQVLLDHYARCG